MAWVYVEPLKFPFPSPGVTQDSFQETAFLCLWGVLHGVVWSLQQPGRSLEGCWAKQAGGGLLLTFPGSLVSAFEICGQSKGVRHGGYSRNSQKHPEWRLVQGKTRRSLEPNAAVLTPQSRAAGQPTL